MSAAPAMGSRVGSLVVVGTGPGKVELMTPASSAAVARATDLVGYGPYLDRIPAVRPDQQRHASDNRVEIERARLALTLAASGRQVVVVSGGDPGVFAMAAAVFEALEQGDPAWRSLDIRVEPGVTAMLAAAAEVGAPLGCLRHLAVGQPQVMGDDRASPDGGRRSRFRYRALQSSLEGAAAPARPGVRSAAQFEDRGHAGIDDPRCRHG
jgi:siroheme synthase